MERGVEELFEAKNDKKITHPCLKKRDNKIKS